MLKAFYRTIIFLLFLLVRNSCFAQHLGAWNIIALKINLNKHWSLFEETQIRSQSFYKDFSYYEIKGGLAYSLKKFSALVGFGRFMTFTDGDNFKKPFTNKEWRMWEQFVFNSYAGRLKIENRIRIEQRWTTSLGYRNRLKYRLNGVLPLTHRKVQPGTIYLTAWDEIYFTDSDPHLETNRIYGGMGYQISKQLTLQTGYLSVVNYRIDETHSGKNYIQSTLLIELNAHKEHHEKTPASVD